MKTLALFVSVLLLLTASTPCTAALSVFNDGGVHEITSSVGAVEISDGPLGDPTIVKLLDGGIVLDIDVLGSSQFLMSGGIINGTLAMKGTSIVEISGGSIDEDPFYLTDSSRLTITGGDFSEGLRLYGSSSATIDGRNFVLDGVPVGYGTLTVATGRLSGELANGYISSMLWINDDASVTLVPEPATLTLLALGAIPLLRRRNRSA